MSVPYPVAPSLTAAQLLLARQWRRECWLLWLHWASAALCPLLGPFFPGVSSGGALLLGLLVTLGTSGQMWLLRQRTTRAHLRTARALATAIEWQAGLGVIALAAYDPDSEAPGLLLSLLILTAARYGLGGLAGATAGAALAVAALVLAQVGPLGALQPAELPDTLRNWGWLVSGLAFVLALLLGPTEGHRGRATPPPPLAPSAAHSLTAMVAPVALAVPLSPREAAILELLREGLLEKEIALRLGISRNTVKTHVLHLRQKLGAEDGSHRAILRAATLRLPSDTLDPSLPPPGGGSATD